MQHRLGKLGNPAAGRSCGEGLGEKCRPRRGGQVVELDGVPDDDVDDEPLADDELLELNSSPSRFAGGWALTSKERLYTCWMPVKSCCFDCAMALSTVAS